MDVIATDKLKSWNTFSKGPLQKLSHTPGQSELSILRLDLIHSWTSGNKYFKLKYVLEQAIRDGNDTIVSKGGMFSNHLSALATACSTFDIHLISIVRSHHQDENNPSIKHLRAMGSEIRYLPPADYNAFDQKALEQLLPGSLFIPEGGLSEGGIKGASEIMDELISHNPTHVIIAGGTMGTACGLITTAPPNTNVIIVPAWKGCTNEYVEDILNRYRIHPLCSWKIWPDYHFGGFARFNEELIRFMKSFVIEKSIPLDPVYTAKMMFAIRDKMKTGYFKSSDSIIAIHTGGLQGLEGFKYLYPAFS